MNEHLLYLQSFLDDNAEAKPGDDQQPPAAPDHPAGNVVASDAKEVAATTPKAQAKSGIAPSLPKAEMSHIKVPGGIAAVLIFVLFLVFAIKPVGDSGKTRLQLLWSVLSGGGAMRGMDSIQTHDSGKAPQPVDDGSSGLDWQDDVMRWLSDGLTR